MRIALTFIVLWTVLLSGCGARNPETPARAEESLNAETTASYASAEDADRSPDSNEDGSDASETERGAADPGAAEGMTALPVLYDFWAVWCPPCREQKPIIEELQGEYAGQVDIQAINVDEQGELAQHFEIKVIPTLVFVDASGKEVERLTGLTPKDKIVERFRAHGFVE